MKDQVTELGDFIRAQRERSAISVRNLAERAGISNPYLSQIERGLRKPSAEILKGIAKGLSISAESLYVRAGLLEHPDGTPSVLEAIDADPTLTTRQRQALTDIYRSFIDQNNDDTK
ncbi:MAG: helix-turn-helix transcriptional regulator [Acidimicrobiia bacterium]|nr:helix-turn-helix transcriptional regulator [Acidimicrobiia bacterium]NNL71085.1 helix-turn-helix transcriptional regulator [Acidimicrobiia bacterium]